MKKLVYTLAFLGLGTFAMAQQTTMPAQKTPAERKAMMEQKRADHMAQMQKDLNLTQAQVAQMKAVQEKFQAQREQQRLQNQQLRKQKMDAMQKDKQQMDDEMRKILTPEQYTKWQAKKQENMQKQRQKMMENNKDRKWGKMPHKNNTKNGKMNREVK